MIKKIFIVVLSVVCTLFVGAVNGEPVFKEYSDRFEVYTVGGSAGKIASVGGTDFFLCRRVKGESFKCAAEFFSVEEFLNDFAAQIMFTEETKEGTSYYAFSESIKYSKTFNDKRINLHVFVGSEQVTVGSPVIYGSF